MLFIVSCNFIHQLNLMTQSWQNEIFLFGPDILLNRPRNNY
jgi:hypothetical protein